MDIALNPLNAELNPICCLLALLGAHHFLHVSRIRVKVTMTRVGPFKLQWLVYVPSSWPLKKNSTFCPLISFMHFVWISVQITIISAYRINWLVFITETEVFKWFMTMHWWFNMRNKNSKCIYRYVNLLCYKQLSLLHVSATYCGHLQGGILWRMYYTESQNSLQI